MAGDDQGGLLEEAWHRPDDSALGTWIRGEEMHMPDGHEAGYAKPSEGNPTWIQEMGSVFVAGGIHAEFWSGPMWWFLLQLRLYLHGAAPSTEVTARTDRGAGLLQDSDDDDNDGCAFALGFGSGL